MTVSEFFGHIACYPDKITYYDNPTNVEDTAKIKIQTVVGVEWNGKIYEDFIKEYGDRIVNDYTIDWVGYGGGITVYLEMDGDEDDGGTD